jgi:hypothetical protein
LSTAARRRRARCRAGSCSSLALALSLSKSNRVATGPNPNPNPDPDAPGQSAAPNLTRLQAFSDVKQSSEAEPQTDQGTALSLSPAARCRKQKGRRPRAEEGYLGAWPSALGPRRLALSPQAPCRRRPTRRRCPRGARNRGSRRPRHPRRAPCSIRGRTRPRP